MNKKNKAKRYLAGLFDCADDLSAVGNEQYSGRQ